MCFTDNKTLGNELTDREMLTVLSILTAYFNIYRKYKQHHFGTKYSFSMVAENSYCSHELQWD